MSSYTLSGHQVVGDIKKVGKVGDFFQKVGESRRFWPVKAGGLASCLHIFSTTKAT